MRESVRCVQRRRTPAKLDYIETVPSRESRSVVDDHSIALLREIRETGGEEIKITRQAATTSGVIACRLITRECRKGAS